MCRGWSIKGARQKDIGARQSVFVKLLSHPAAAVSIKSEFKAADGSSTLSGCEDESASHRSDGSELSRQSIIHPSSTLSSEQLLSRLLTLGPQYCCLFPFRFIYQRWASGYFSRLRLSSETKWFPAKKGWSISSALRVMKKNVPRAECLAAGL